VGPSSRGVARCEAKADHEFLARMSYVEIYNEEARTLTHTHGSTHALARVHVHASYTYLHAGTRARRRAVTGRAVRQVKDLLDDSGTVAGGLAVVEDPKTGPYVKGAVDKVLSLYPHAPAGVRTNVGLHSLTTAQVVLRSDDALEVLYEGEKNRHFAATAMNNHSSRRCVRIACTTYQSRSARCVRFCVRAHSAAAHVCWRAL
jgi:hypothetical protein